MITHNCYISGTVDSNAMEAQALNRAKKGEGSILHYHAYGEACTDKCHTVKESDEA